ncbi:MAG TPA: phosphatidylserine decarboxylase [Vicinamibacterales bacterium]|nr:phosphatidylserine decarboxylase [Vicinamibacterales bacterium]
MGIDRSGWPFILVALIIGLLVGWSFGSLWAIPFLFLSAFFLFFFRDPDRTVPADPHLVVSPADGRVMIVGDPPRTGAPAGEWQRITIFLSPMDVHINRAPVDGRITKVEYHAGKFLPAYKEEAGTHNEWTEVWIEHGGMPIVVRQIVGILARRIVTRLEVGQQVTRGERFGIMKFGSRIDLYLPLSAKMRVKPGDKVVGGESTLATLER